MQTQTQFIIRIDKALKEKAQKKAKETLGIGLGTLTKLFLQAFISKSEISISLGDKEFDAKLDELLKSEKTKKALLRLGDSL